MSSLGIADAVRRIGQPIRGLRIYLAVSRRLSIALPSRGPYGPVGIPRDALDALLANAAARHGARIDWQTRVLGVEQADGLATAVLARRRRQVVRYRPRWIIAADGRYSVVARVTGRIRRRRCLRRSAVKLHVAVGPWPDIVELFTFGTGYFGSAPVGNGVVNLCGLLPRQLLHQHRGRVDAVLVDVLRGWPCLAALQEGRVLNRMAMPDVSLQCAEPRCGNVLYAGDALATMEPATGQGITAALWSGRMAAESVRRWWRSYRCAQRAYLAAWRKHLAAKRAVSGTVGTVFDHATGMNMVLKGTGNLLGSARAVLRQLYRLAQV